jgi:hypothetical protein
MTIPASDLLKLPYDKYAIGDCNMHDLEPTLGLFQGCAAAQSQQ